MERLKNVAVIIGLLLSLITLYNWGSKLFAHEVVAELDPGAFAIPPQLDSFYSKLAESLTGDALVERYRNDESLKKLFSLKELPEDQRESTLRLFTGLLPRESQTAIPFDFKNIESYWSGTVKNSSKARVNTVQLYLNSAKFVLLKRDDNSTNAQTVENLINIGDLRPGETVQISIWSRSRFKYFSGVEARLTHASGVGKVIVSRPVTGFPAFIDKYDFAFYIIVFWLFAGLVLPLSIQRLLEWRSLRRK